jgi:curved DNA-binding protein CbpA
MAAGNAQTNLYDVLQVAPSASDEDIAAAYERLHTLYDPEQLRGGPPEFASLAQQKRAELAQAYHVLGDEARRAAYDQTRSGVANGHATVLDYRPLPPAQGHERERIAAQAETVRAERIVRRAGVRGWLPGVVLALGGLALLLLLIFSNVRADGSPQALATPALTSVQLPHTDTQIEQFRRASQVSNSAQTWTALGNALFDNLQTLRENVPQSPYYQSALPQWLEAAQAYERALAIQENETTRSDLALTLWTYGTDANDVESRQRGVAEAEQAVQRGVTESRALINYGLVLAGAEPPRVDDAVRLWQRVVETAPDSPEAVRAQQLLQSYGRASDPQS